MLIGHSITRLMWVTLGRSHVTGSQKCNTAERYSFHWCTKKQVLPTTCRDCHNYVICRTITLIKAAKKYTVPSTKIAWNSYPKPSPHEPRQCVKKVPFPMDFCLMITTHILYWVIPQGMHPPKEPHFQALWLLLLRRPTFFTWCQLLCCPFPHLKKKKKKFRPGCDNLFSWLPSRASLAIKLLAQTCPNNKIVCVKLKSQNMLMVCN